MSFVSYHLLQQLMRLRELENAAEIVDGVNSTVFLVIWMGSLRNRARRSDLLHCNDIVYSN